MLKNSYWYRVISVGSWGEFNGHTKTFFIGCFFLSSFSLIELWSDKCDYLFDLCDNRRITCGKFVFQLWLSTCPAANILLIFYFSLYSSEMSKLLHNLAELHEKMWNHIIIIVYSHLSTIHIVSITKSNGIFSQLIAFTCQLQLESPNHMVSHVKNIRLFLRMRYIQLRNKWSRKTHTNFVSIFLAIQLQLCEQYLTVFETQNNRIRAKRQRGR